MKCIKRGTLWLFKKAYNILYKHASVVLIYLLLLIVAITAGKCFKIKGFQYGVFTLFFFAGVLVYSIYKKLSKKLYKFSYMIIVLISYYHLGRYVLKLKLESFSLKVLSEINFAIYNSLHLDFELLFPYLFLIVPVLGLSLLYLDELGKGEPLMLLVILFMADIWLNGFDNNVKIHLIIALFLLMIYYTLVLYKKNQRLCKRKNLLFSVNRKNILIYGLMLSSCTLIIASTIIKITGTSNLSEIISKIQSKNLKISDEGKNNLYDIGFSGYNVSKLGGPITLNSKIAFRVKSDKPYYLRGSVKDYYDGHSWKKSDEKLYIKGNGKFISADSEYNNFLKPTAKKMTIYPEALQTSTLFTPYGTSNIRIIGEPVGFTDTFTFFLLNKSSPATYYTVDFYESELGIENFISTNDNDFNLGYEVMGKDKSEIEYYEKNIKKEYDKYLTLPKIISPGTKDLVQNIISNSENTKERIYSIYNYLKNNYTYSLDVSNIPDEKEFLDYFLFTEKKGYCTYFATAAVMFCRMAGIPARYVEGFNMKDLKDNNGLYIVTNDRAHAWCEILISKELNIWSVLDCVPDVSGLEDRNNLNPEDVLRDVQLQLDETDTMDQGTPSVNIPVNDLYQIEILKNDRRLSIISKLKYFLYSLPYIFVLSLLAYIIRKIYLHENEKLGIIKSTSVAPIYDYSKARIKTIGIEYKKSQTEFEYLNTIEDPNLKNRLLQLIEVYNKECYGNKKIENFDKDEYYNFIEKYIRERQNIIKYFWKKYL